MRKNRQRACHYRYVLPGTGRNASLSSRSHCAQFLLAHLMAFQYVIFSLNLLPSSDSPIQKLSGTNSIIAGILTRCSLSSADWNDGLQLKPFTNFSLGTLEAEKGCVHVRGFEGNIPRKKAELFAAATRHPAQGWSSGVME